MADHLVTRRATVSQATPMQGYDPTTLHLHGGPASLDGGRLRIGPKGGLFLIPDSEAGTKHALRFAVLCGHQNTGIWRCNVSLPVDSVFDFTNPQHRARLADAAGPDHMAQFDARVMASGGHQIPWTRNANITTWRPILTTLGFSGSLFLEQCAQRDYAQFLCVFDQDAVEIVDFTRKADALSKYCK